jgi:predicted MFS family arabinose efflux permease
MAGLFHPGYRAEFRAGWRAILATAFGIGAGVALSIYLSNLFLPHLSAEFGWTDAQFALTGLAALGATGGVLVSGRLADRFGVRRVACLGLVGMPLMWLAFSRLSGDIRLYYALFTLMMLVGTTTTSVVYARVTAERFNAARGLALALAIGGAPVAGGLAAPLVSAVIETWGWREGYVSVAALSALLGLVAWRLLPDERGPGFGTITPSLLSTRAAYGLLARSPLLWLLIAAMLLCNLPALMVSLQTKPLLLSLGVAPGAVGWLISVYAAGVLVGRLACGLALDSLPAHRVAAVAMGLPALGLSLLAAGPDGLATVVVAMALLGISQGAEGDIVAYLVARQFAFTLFGTVAGLITASIGIAAALGGVLLSVILGAGGSYTPFLWLTAATVAVGATLFLAAGLPALAHRVGDD